MVNPRLFTFVGGDDGPWVVESMTAVIGEPLAKVSRLAIREGEAPPASGGWALRGVTSNQRYATHHESEQLKSIQASLGRPEANRAALIPIRKSPAWWALSQDERREVFEERSRHNALGMRYLPAIARRLHHCRDLATTEPFDFLTFFDYAEGDAPAFDELVAELRASDEWQYVDREIDIRLVRGEPSA